MKPCLDCGIDISDRGPTAIRCKSCAYKYKRRNRPPRQMVCITCGADITDRYWNAKYCHACDTERRHAEKRAYYHRVTKFKRRGEVVTKTGTAKMPTNWKYDDRCWAISGPGAL
jgi:DNA-directed RNA polymerase subunit RPC12/RpoP